MLPPSSFVSRTEGSIADLPTELERAEQLHLRDASRAGAPRVALAPAQHERAAVGLQCTVQAPRVDRALVVGQGVEQADVDDRVERPPQLVDPQRVPDAELRHPRVAPRPSSARSRSLARRGRRRARGDRARRGRAHAHRYHSRRRARSPRSRRPPPVRPRPAAVCPGPTAASPRRPYRRSSLGHRRGLRNSDGRRTFLATCGGGPSACPRSVASSPCPCWSRSCSPPPCQPPRPGPSGSSSPSTTRTSWGRPASPSSCIRTPTATGSAMEVSRCCRRR